MPLGDLKTSNNVLFHLARMEARGFDAEQVLAGTGLTVEDVNVDFFRPEPGQWRDIISNIIRQDCCMVFKELASLESPSTARGNNFE